MNIETIQKKQQKMLKKITLTGSKHTKKKYNTAFNNFNTFLETKDSNKINNENINDILIDYLTYLTGNDETQKPTKKLSNNTINQYMILIKKFLANECKLTIEKIELLKTEKKEPRYISIIQYQEIMRYLEQKLTQCNTKHQEKIIQTDITIINLLFNTGLRIHEALKITIDELTNTAIDHNNNYQLKVIGKGNKKRTIIITSKTYNQLMHYIQAYNKPGNTYIFESNKAPGNPITTTTIERHLTRIAKELDNIHGNDANDNNSYQELLKPHNLRHSYAVSNLENGMPINAMQKLLGHSNITTTQIYTELNSDSLSDAVAKASQ